MDDEGVVVVQLFGDQLVLLGSLVLSVVIKAPSEPDLSVVVDITSNLRGNIFNGNFLFETKLSTSFKRVEVILNFLYVR